MAEANKDADIIELLTAIKASVDDASNRNDVRLEDLEAAFGLICDISDRNKCWKWNYWLRDCAASIIRRSSSSNYIEKATSLLRRSYLLGARRENFDDYCIWLEIDRPKEQRFYQVRRKCLLPLVHALQDLYDRKIRFLAVSMPPRVGKSTVCFLFLSFVVGHHPLSHNLCVGYSTTLAKEFFGRIEDFIKLSDYRWNDVFPQLTGITRDSVEDLCFDVKTKPTAFPTMVCRGIDGSLTGGCDVSEDGVLYCDDLVRDYEEALNPNRMNMLWGKYVNQVRDRMKGGAMQLMVGTRWNVYDPIGMMQSLYEGNPEYRFLVIPALDDNDESNFAYDRDGFSTADYRELRRITGDAEWKAKYCGEPYVREGIIFGADELRYYNGELPEGKPDQIIATVDVAFGGGDSVCMPIGYVYGQGEDAVVFIPDVVFNNGATGTTTRIVAARIMQHDPERVVIEENSGGLLYKGKVEEILQSYGYMKPLKSKRARKEIPKVDRILFRCEWIKAHFVFLEPRKQNLEYRQFMRELTTYTAKGKNPHDDAPDGCAQLADEIDIKHASRAFKVMERLF